MTSTTLRTVPRLQPKTIKRISLLLLAVGFGAAVAVFLLAAPAPEDSLNGDLLDRKKYIHELRVMGGKGNVAAAEFMDWFGGFWHGRPLAGTVAVLTILTVLLFRFVAQRPDLYRSPAPPPTPGPHPQPPADGPARG